MACNLGHRSMLHGAQASRGAVLGVPPRANVLQRVTCRAQQLDVLDVEVEILARIKSAAPGVPDAPSAAPVAANEYVAPTLGMQLGRSPLKQAPESRPLLPSFDPALVADLLGFNEVVVPDYLEGLQRLSEEAGGPVVYQLPRTEGSPDPKTLPLLLYLPGIDGTGLAAYRQFPSLTQKFELRGLFIPPKDRSSFEDIVDAAQRQLEAELVGGDPLRPVYLMGESFGGLVALSLAQKCDAVDRVILCNPATSFADSVWPLAGPLLTALPKEVYNALPIALSPILTNPLSIAMHGLPKSPFGGLLPHSPLDIASTTAWGLIDLLPELGSLRAVLPSETLAHRLKLLRNGSKAVNATLNQVQQRVLLLAGENDMVIPSATEGPRLKKALPRCVARILPGRSHAMLQEAGIDLVSIIEEEGFYVPRRKLTSMPAPRKAGDKNKPPRSGATFGRALPLELPTSVEYTRALNDGGVSLLSRIVSPVFFSTNTETGALEQGLKHVPLGRPGKPVLLVGNHQTFAPDLPILISGFLEERGVLVRGLAHPVALDGPGAWSSNSNRQQNRDGNNSFGSFLKTFGAVPVSGKSMHTLFDAGETVLVFPGGVREALKLRNEQYQLIWPNRPEFVRMAAKFGATIVPFGAVGAEDGINQVLDAQEMQSLPIIGDWIRSQQSGAPQARGGVTASDTNVDNFTAPIITLNPPARFYLAFGKPIETSPELATNRAECDRLYNEVRDSCAGTISYLLRKRDDDPYADLIKRVLYEASWSGRKQAPTFTP